MLTCTEGRMSFRTALVPCGGVERVQWDLEVATPIIFRCRKPPSRDVDLQGGQDQLRHWQGPVAVRAELDETCLVLGLSHGHLPPSVEQRCFPTLGAGRRADSRVRRT